MNTHPILTTAAVAAAALLLATAVAASQPNKRYTLPAAASPMWAGAPSPFKRYTLPAARPSTVASPGALTVLLPSDWQVKTAWPPSARDPQHPSVAWSMNTSLQPVGTTLAGIRGSYSWANCRKGWGYEEQVADAYLTLPVGRVWHYTMGIYADKQCTSAIAEAQRYWLDRKVVSRDGQEVFLVIDAWCSTKQCPTHNGQFAAIMRSIRIKP